MSADFSQLYARLGIGADCSLEEFKRACRRRIRAQHPDLPGNAGAAADAGQIPLSEFLPLYAKALRFHRKHGRLPGAAPAAPAPPAASRERMSMAAMAPSPPPAAAPPATGNALRRSLRAPLLALVAVAIIIAAIGTRKDDDAASRHPRPARAVPLADDGAGDDAQAQARLELGMDPDTVRGIQGEPMQWSGTEWSYGPSWLRFEDDRLVDWYSSPLHPLRTATASPPPESTQADADVASDE
ncbi:MAG TPA: hypothetical protein VM619_10365 [Luteimonas sp.]|nr:hypothetical protein [Luteimonas sp.]